MAVLNDLRTLAARCGGEYTVSAQGGAYTLRERARSPRHSGLHQDHLRYIVQTIFGGVIDSVSGHTVPYGWVDEAIFTLPPAAGPVLTRRAQQVREENDANVLRWLTEAGEEGCRTRYWSKEDLEAAKRLTKAGRAEPAQDWRGKVLRYRLREEVSCA